ncbi:MAG: hypothetical protein JO023_21490 [Chloroflexi bacterium]|nr:hypothetical protein [Chloroflexota bacterium]
MLAAAGCGRVDALRPPAPTPVPVGDQEALVDQSRQIVAQALVSLRALDTFAAWRISRAGNSSLRSPSELEWDPPSASAWAAVDRLAALRDQAQAMYQSITGAPDDADTWRSRRQLAEMLHRLVDAIDGQLAYRAALDQLAGPDGEASAVTNLLDRAHVQWQVAAGALGISNVETISAS